MMNLMKTKWMNLRDRKEELF